MIRCPGDGDCDKPVKNPPKVPAPGIEVPVKKPEVKIPPIKHVPAEVKMPELIGEPVSGEGPATGVGLPITPFVPPAPPSGVTVGPVSPVGPGTGPVVRPPLNVRAYMPVSPIGSSIGSGGAIRGGGGGGGYGGGSGTCFVRDTPVWTEAGAKHIQDVCAGDYVWSFNETSGNVELALVVTTFMGYRSDLVKLTVEGESLLCSRNHRFYVGSEGWKPADELSNSDEVFSGDFGRKTISPYSIRTVAVNRDRKVPVFNFEVMGNHNYFVGPKKILCHNTKAAQYEADLTGASGIFSSRRFKQDLVFIQGYGILKKVTELPIYNWKYNWDPDDVRHIGPIAEDFYETFRVGANRSFIQAVDGNGVALAAIKELAKMAEDSSRRHREAETSINQIQAVLDRNRELEAIVERLQTEIRQAQNTNADLLSRLERVENAIEGIIPKPSENASIPKRE